MSCYFRFAFLTNPKESPLPLTNVPFPLSGSFPCNRVLPTDVFREGGFDYPYPLQQAQVVAPLVFAFLTQVRLKS